MEEGHRRYLYRRRWGPGGKESMNGSSEYVGVLLVGRSDAVGTLVRTRLQNLFGKIEEVTWCAESECAMLEM